MNEKAQTDAPGTWVSVTDVWNQVHRLEAENDRLRRQVAALLDVKNAAQQLVDLLHYQKNATAADTFAKRFDNLTDALKAWYMPNGNGR